MVAPGANQVATSHHDRGPKQSPKNLPEEHTPSHPSGCTNLLRLTNCLRKNSALTPRDIPPQTPADKNAGGCGSGGATHFYLD